MTTVSVIVACHNEQDNLRLLHSQMTAVLRKCCEDYEIVLVNDGSRDSTWGIICSLSFEDRHVVGINLSRNYGHQIAVTAGVEHSRFERVLVIDADLQDPPELLLPMMKMMDEGADVVYGRRVKRHDERLMKRLTAAVFYRCLRRMADFDMPPDSGDFRLMSRRVVEALRAMPEQQRYLRGMVSWIGFRQVPIDYERAPRHAGRTSYNWSRMLAFAMDAFTSFTIKPLRFASWLGLFAAICTIPVMFYSLFQWWEGHTVAGWTSLMGVILFFGSVQLAVLGIMGEYVGRLMIEAKHRPLYLIADIRAQPLDEQILDNVTNLAIPEKRRQGHGSVHHREGIGARDHRASVR
jgi:glycosyltransferase involved in cell wall biosynthesis